MHLGARGQSAGGRAAAASGRAPSGVAWLRERAPSGVARMEEPSSRDDCRLGIRDLRLGTHTYTWGGCQVGLIGPFFIVARWLATALVARWPSR